MCLRAAHTATGVQVAGRRSTSDKKSSIGRSQHKKYILRTPALHDACEESLFRIVRDVGAKPVDDLSEMAIREANNLWGCHAKLK